MLVQLYQTIKHHIRYGLDGPGFEHRWEWGFSCPSRLVPKTTHPLVQGVPAFFSREKLARACCWPPIRI